MKKRVTNQRKFFTIRLRIKYFAVLCFQGKENFMRPVVSVIALALVVIGALNWGLWGFFQFDLVAWLFGGNTSVLSRVVYGIVGIAGLVSISVLMRCKKCACPCHKKDSCGKDGKGKGCGSCK